MVGTQKSEQDSGNPSFIVEHTPRDLASPLPTSGSSNVSLDRQIPRERLRQRRRRVRGRGNAAQLINTETHFIDRITSFFSRKKQDSASAQALALASSNESIPANQPGSPMDVVDPDELTEEEKLEDLKFYMEQIYLILKPVLCCIFLSILWVKLTTDYSSYFDTGIGLPSAPSSAVGTAFGVNDGNSGSAFVSALTILGQIVGATIVVVALFYFNCMKVLYVFFIIVVTALLGTFGWTLGVELLQVHNLSLDHITFWFFIWNLTAVGVLSIFYKGPLILQQVYLVLMSSMMAYTLTKLPALTTWILLALLAIWDLIAVLCPFGPLRILVETSQNNEREIPALLYTVMVWLMAAPGTPPSSRRPITAQASAATGTGRLPSDDSSNDSSLDRVSDFSEFRELTSSRPDTHPPRDMMEMQVRDSASSQPISAINIDGPHGGEELQFGRPLESETRCREQLDAQAEEEEEEAARGGLKLGLGDFVFYSVLVARAAMFDWITTVACTVAVLTGLNMTIFLLALYRKALPALPISIAFGILFYFLSSVTLTPFVSSLVTMPGRVTVQGADTWLWVGRGGGGGMVYV
ncbi:hypothetical protein HDU85_002887 [Gaertneriomyces sp. JEL0708]|nr:hypothetical protein HDU85_002887 [Gaertneriomyces sp. JEL0708]